MNNELEHVGVKGMKWGHRKAQQSPEQKKAYKTAVRAERSKMYADIGNHKAGMAKRAVPAGAAYAALSVANGKSAVGSMFNGAAATGNVAVSYGMLRSAGYSKGKATAWSFLGGPIMGISAIEFEARKRAKENG